MELPVVVVAVQGFGVVVGVVVVELVEIVAVQLGHLELVVKIQPLRLRAKLVFVVLVVLVVAVEPVQRYCLIVDFQHSLVEC